VTAPREKFTAAHKAELKAGFKESLAAYEREREERQNRPAPAPGDPKAAAIRDAFLLTGDIAELVHSVSACASEIGERDVTAAVKAVRASVTDLGNLLAQKQRRRA
jgi:hypothetical protein